MKKLSLSTKIFLCLVIFYAFLAALNLYLPQGDYMAQQISSVQLPAAKWFVALAAAAMVFVVYGALGFIGLKLSAKIGFPAIWDANVSNKQRFLIPGVIGAVSGLILIIGDVVFSRFNGIGRFIHPPFPASLAASFSAGVGEEILFRLFFVSFWVWFVSLILLKGRWQKQIFWIVAILSALAFAAGHYPATMIMFGFKTMAAIPWVLQVEIILSNGLIGFLAAYYFRKYGFLAAVGIHFWCDIVWHATYGFFIK